MRALLVTTFFASCTAAPPPSFDCHRAADCDDGFCVSGRCVGHLAAAQAEEAVAHRWADAGDAIVPQVDAPGASVPPPCRGAVAASPANIVVNEVLVNVPQGPAGDANGDGLRDPYDDEFVELANPTAEPVDMAGVTISNGNKLKFWFEPFCLLPGESVVVFGGGSVGSSVTTAATISDTSFAFGNEGGTVVVGANAGEIARVQYGKSDPVSLTRTPQLVGNQWVPHTALNPAPFSPGTCPDGSPLATGCTQTMQAPSSDAGTD